MAWSTPRTWVAGELVTASIMNTHVRDQLNAVANWSARAYNSGDFTINGGTTLTVDSGDLVTFEYKVHGGTMVIDLNVGPVSITGGTNPDTFSVLIPESRSARKETTIGCRVINNNTWEAGHMYVTASGTTVNFRRGAFNPFTNPQTNALVFSGVLEFPIN